VSEHQSENNNGNNNGRGQQSRVAPQQISQQKKTHHSQQNQNSSVNQREAHNSNSNQIDSEGGAGNSQVIQRQHTQLQGLMFLPDGRALIMDNTMYQQVIDKSIVIDLIDPSG